MSPCRWTPKKLTWPAAALTEPLSGAWKGVIQYSQMQVGDDVVVIGVGSIGLLCLMVARSAGLGASSRQKKRQGNRNNTMIRVASRSRLRLLAMVT